MCAGGCGCGEAAARAPARGGGTDGRRDRGSEAQGQLARYQSSRCRGEGAGHRILRKTHGGARRAVESAVRGAEVASVRGIVGADAALQHQTTLTADETVSTARPKAKLRFLTSNERSASDGGSGESLATLECLDGGRRWDWRLGWDRLKFAGRHRSALGFP